MILRTALVVLACAAPANAAETCDPAAVVFPANEARAQAARVAVEVADTDAERARGLMFRRDLPPGQGMLFVYPAPQQVAFWMRNTLIPLDMLFVDGAGVVRHIHRGARPHDETPIPGAAPGDPAPERQFVLEVAAGEVDRLGLSVGDALASPLVAQGKAAAPCR